MKTLVILVTLDGQKNMRWGRQTCGKAQEVHWVVQMDVRSKKASEHRAQRRTRRPEGSPAITGLCPRRFCSLTSTNGKFINLCNSV